MMGTVGGNLSAPQLSPDKLRRLRPFLQNSRNGNSGLAEGVF